MEWISEALNNFTQKMKWRRFFIKQKCDDHVAPFSTRYKQKPITRFTMSTEPELNEWLRQLCREVWMVCKVAVDRNRHRMKEYSNSTPLIKWGIKCLLKGQWFVFKTDKDGGYARVKKEQADTIFESLVTTKNYVEIPVSATRWEHLESKWKMVMNAILKKDKRVKWSDLTSSMYMGSKWISLMQCTVKTHKTQGEVMCRPIHGTARFAFSGISRWVSAVLREILNQQIHIVRDSEDLIRKIKDIKIEPSMWFMKGDIKDFFMTGEPQQLIHPCVNAVKEEFREPLREALEFLIENQFVQIPGCEHRAWKVCRGSGMGLPHSGEVADMVFLMNERKFILVSENIMKYSIKAYFRYKDDMMMIIDNTGSNVPRVWYRYKICAAPFEVKMDSISQNECIMLDTRFFKGQRHCATGKMDYEVFFKHTSTGQTLNSDSFHLNSTHRAWPKAEVGRILRRSSSITNF